MVGDAEDAKATLDSTIVDIKEFGKQKATADLRVDAEQAKRDIAEVVAEMKAVPKEETIRIRVAGEQAKLQGLLASKAGMENRLQNAAATGAETDPLVKRLASYSSQIEATRGRITGLASEFDQLGQRGAKDVTKLAEGLPKIVTGLAQARGGLASFISNALEKLPLIGGLFASIATKAAELLTYLAADAGEGLGGMAAQAAAFAPLIAVFGVLISLAAALAVSIGQALIGIVALGVAFLVVLAPIVAVLGIVLVKIKDIVTGQIALKQANAGLKSAVDAQKSAVIQLHQAEVTQAQTRIQAIQAERSALLQLVDAENAVADARLGIQSAQLQLSQARLTLLKFKQGLAGMGTTPGDLLGKSSNVSVGGNMGQTQQGSSPLAWLSMLLQYKQDVLDVKTAAQGTVDSVAALKDATNNQLTAQENWAQYLKLGLKAYQPYMQAVNALKTSQQNLIRSNDQLAASELAKRLAIRHGASEAVSFMTAWDKIKKTMGVVFGPAEAAVFKGIEQSMGILAGHGKTLTPAFTKLGIAIGNAFVWWAKMMTKPGNVQLVVTLIKQAATWITTMSGYLGSAFKFIILIAEAAMPSLIAIFKHWGNQLSNANGHTVNIHRFIGMCIAKATTFWHTLQNIAGVLGTIASTFKTIETIVGVIAAPFKTAFQVGKDLVSPGGGGVGTAAAVPASIASGAQFLKWIKSHAAADIGGQIMAGGSSQSADVKALDRWLQVQSAKLAAAHPAGHVTHVTQHIPVTNVGDAHHFARVMKKNLQGLAGGVN